MTYIHGDCSAFAAIAELLIAMRANGWMCIGSFDTIVKRHPGVGSTKYTRSMLTVTTVGLPSRPSRPGTTITSLVPRTFEHEQQEGNLHEQPLHEQQEGNLNEQPCALHEQPLHEQPCALHERHWNEQQPPHLRGQQAPLP